MANPSLQSFTSRGLALKLETTEGTDASPTALLNAFQMIDGSSAIVADAVQRNIDRPFFNSASPVYSNFRGQINGNIELVAPAVCGTDDASVNVALQIAGMAVTKTAHAAGPPVVKGLNRYNPISVAIPSATAYWWHAGNLLKVTGARANITGLAMEIGKYLTAQFALEGSLEAWTEQALPTNFDFTKFTTPPVLSTESMELLINSFAVFGKLHSIDFGNQLKTIEHTEARTAQISNKQSTFTARFFRTLQADFDPVAKWQAGDQVTIQSTVLENDGLRKTVLTTQGVITNFKTVNIDDDYGYEITGNLVASSAGNDECFVDFSEV